MTGPKYHKSASSLSHLSVGNSPSVCLSVCCLSFELTLRLSVCGDVCLSVCRLNPPSVGGQLSIFFCVVWWSALLAFCLFAQPSIWFCVFRL